MKPDLTFLSPEKREAFQTALNRFYDGDLEWFLAQTSRALIDAYESNQQADAPSRLRADFPERGRTSRSPRPARHPLRLRRTRYK